MLRALSVWLEIINRAGARGPIAAHGASSGRVERRARVGGDDNNNNNDNNTNNNNDDNY